MENEVSLPNSNQLENEQTTIEKEKLKSWLNKTLRIEMTDGRVLIGVFLCTDRDANVILGSCSEYLPTSEGTGIDEPRVLGLVMVPGRHIVSIHLDDILTKKPDDEVEDRPGTPAVDELVAIV